MEPTCLAAPQLCWMAECHICGRTIAADQPDMARYIRDGWPPCCGHAMTFWVVRAVLAAEAETKT